jgi:hypothetical protein
MSEHGGKPPRNTDIPTDLIKDYFLRLAKA